MPRKILTLIDTILEGLLESLEVLPHPLETKYQWVKRLRGTKRYKFNRSIAYLKQQKLITVTKKNSEIFVKLTSKGEIQALLQKAKLSNNKVWDGHWRLVMFDIPEDSRDQRNLLRGLLKENNFRKLQASVFISPYPLNREAVLYLKRTQLIRFIRIMRVDEMDNDKELKKLFKIR